MRIGLDTWKEKLKGKNRYETAENYSIAAIAFGVFVISVGFILSIFNPRGLSAILLMLGSFLSFISTIVLIFVWLIKELKG